VEQRQDSQAKPLGITALTLGPYAGAAGEITDKGTINQRAVLHCRQVEIERLYSPGDSRVAVLS